MSDGESDDLSAIAWPGFVDILSSVIIMFVFFVMVVASALYFHIIIFKSKILSEEGESNATRQEAKELAKTNRSLMKKIKDMDEKMKLLEEINEENEIQLFQESTQFSESLEQELKEDPETNSLVIFFGKDSISVIEEIQQQLDGIIKKYAQKFGASNTKIDIASGKNPESLNDVFARKLAVARMLNVRNTVLVSDVPPENVIPRIANEGPIDKTYNWVKITFSPKQ